jgi:hypothetical protein
MMIRAHALRTKLLIGMVLSIAAVGSSAASASDKLPPALSASQVSSQVASSLSITKIPKTLATPLTSMSTDHIDRYYPTLKIGCYNYNAACTFGTAKAKKTLVLLGDSHAAMWAPALIPTANAAGYKVVVLWYPNCPAADVTPFNLARGALDLSCATWHHRIFGDISKAKPAVVVLSEATTLAESASSTPFTSAEWQAGLERTMTAVGGSATRVVMVADIPVYSESPANCLARNPLAIQQCSTQLMSSDPALRQLISAENAASLSKAAKFVSLTSLLCASSCSPIVGNHVTYFDTNHVASSYAATIRTPVWSQMAKAIDSRT